MSENDRLFEGGILSVTSTLSNSKAFELLVAWTELNCILELMFTYTVPLTP